MAGRFTEFAGAGVLAGHIAGDDAARLFSAANIDTMLVKVSEPTSA